MDEDQAVMFSRRDNQNHSSGLPDSSPSPATASPSHPSKAPLSAVEEKYFVADEGKQLFQYFFTHQAKIDNLESLPFESPVLPVEQVKHAQYLIQVGQEFSNTEGRQHVQDLVMKVDSMSSHDLQTVVGRLLTKVEGLVEGVVVVFFFCYDLAIRELTKSRTRFDDYVEISKECIDTVLEPKIRENGGWHQVLDERKHRGIFSRIKSAINNFFTSLAGVLDATDKEEDHTMHQN